MKVIGRTWSLGVLAVCLTAALVFRQFAFVAYYPVGMGGFLALAFGLSLFGKPLCLTLAEALPPHVLPPGAAAYCRRLTCAWFLLLSANALVALATVFAPRWVWFAWNCALSYGVMGAMILAERAVRRRHFAVTFSSSGSTAAPKRIVKTYESLLREAVFHRDHTLKGVFSGGAPVTILSTVDPRHLYGRIWCDLLPRVAGVPVPDEVILAPETLVRRMREAKRVLLVTTPSFLRHFCAYGDLYDLPSNCVEIVTSGSLLSAETAAAARSVFGRAPLEIFGATETGGVAWRRQGPWEAPSAREDAASELWSVFDPVSVAVSKEGLLTVSSPFSCRPAFTLGDGVALTADRRHFTLLGRRDRVVKIAEQRLSLADLERAIAALPGLREVALVPLEGPRGTVLGAVVALDVAAFCAGAGEGEKTFSKRALSRLLRAAFQPLFPPGSVPRKYRLVHELPRNPQGKVQQQVLRACFDSDFGEPLVLSSRRQDKSWSLDVVFDAEAPYFQGHFPQGAVLPGVVQVLTAWHFVRQAFAPAGELRGVSRLKFMKVILPGEVVRLDLVRQGEGEVLFAFARGAETCSTGRLFVATPQVPATEVR